MPTLNQIVYRHAETNRLDDSLGFGPVSSSLVGTPTLQLWQARIEPWLRTRPGGSPPPSLFYGTFTEDAVLIRRIQSAEPASASAHVLIGPVGVLTPKLALELREWRWAQAEWFTPVRRLDVELLADARSSLEVPARSEVVLPRLTSVLAVVLSQETRRVVVPAFRHSEAVLWGLRELLAVLLEGCRDVDQWALSFETYDDRTVPVTWSLPGLFVAFRRGAPAPEPAPRFAAAAKRITAAYAEGGADSVRRLLNENLLLAITDAAARLTRLAGSAQPPTAPTKRLGVPVTTPSTAGGATPQVSCPICLSRLDWDELPLYRFDANLARYVELRVPENASPAQRAKALRTASVRCTNSGELTPVHFLPSAYGKYGEPSVYGFVGAFQSGKTHLLTAMVGAIEQGGLSSYGLTARPVDLNLHQSYVRDSVRPLFGESKVLAPTRDGMVSFVDAFLVSEAGRDPKAVALFDVAGRELLLVEEAKSFLDIADGLIFVVDPEQFDGDGLGDLAFSTVLAQLKAVDRLDKVSAAVVLNKADMVRFDDPVSYWLRRDVSTLDPVESLRESADVYAYLYRRGAHAWTRPYQECARATLHVASGIGSGRASSDESGIKRYQRGVRPRRVLGPLVSLLAMTGVLTAPEAQLIGI